MHPVGTILAFAGLIVPPHWMESKGVIACTEVPKLCEALKSYYVQDGILTLPDFSSKIKQSEYNTKIIFIIKIDDE